MRLAPLLLVAFILPLVSCSSTPKHGVASNLSEVTTAEAAPLCQHRVPEAVCVQCDPSRAGRFKEVGDWCGEHGIPESQCYACHPDLSFAPAPKPPEGADVKVLSAAGEDVESLEAHAVKGKVTVFDFYADWCAPCRDIDAHLVKRLQQGDELAYRKLNVVSWETPLAKRYLARVPNLPFVIVYGKDGAPVAEVSGFDLAALDRAIEQGARQ